MDSIALAERVTRATTHVNGTDLYHTIRGSGPPIVFVQGTTGDDVSFQVVGDLLADEFTVVTYHRRGNSWSPPPDGWTSTTVDEQADDLAALIEALGLSPAAVFGTSDGATILLNVLVRHPGVLSGAIVHEPLLEPLIGSDGEAREAIDHFYGKIVPVLEADGPRAAMEALIRAIVGDATFERRDPAIRERLVGNGEVYFSIEAEAFSRYMPDPDDLARVTVPVMVAAGEVDILGGGFRQTCAWVANHLGTTVQTLPGAHTPYVDVPNQMAAAIRPFLHEVSAAPQVRQEPVEIRPLLSDVTGQGDPLVLVPGGLSGWLSWIPLASRLAAGRTAIRVQLRGLELAGAGAPIPETYGRATETNALSATVDALGLDRFDLAGWSLGGAIALDFAIAHPERVRSLTLIEPAAYWLLRETGAFPEALAALEATDRSLHGRTVTADDLKAFLVRAGLGQPGDTFEAHPSWAHWMRNRQILAHIGMVWDDEGSLDLLGAMDIPVLAVHGTESTRQDIAIVKALSTLVPQVTLLELPGDHACHLENMDAFLEALETHIAGAKPHAEGSRPSRDDLHGRTQE